MNGGKPIVVGVKEEVVVHATFRMMTTTVKKVMSSSTGTLRTTVKATAPGTWRWTYYGNSTAGPKSSTGDYVTVR